MSSTAPNHRRQPLASESGSIIILTALSMVVLLGILAFAVDASFLYTERNRMAAAADAAAKAGALENHRGVTNLEPFVYREVTLLGFNPGGTTSVVWHRPPVTGAFLGDVNYVEVSVSQQTSTFFARGVSAAFGSVTPLARAVAGTSSGPNCIVALGPDSPGHQTMDVANGVVISMTGCGIADGGTFGTKPTTQVNAGEVSVTAGACPSNVTNCTSGVPPPTDPLASLPPPPDPGGSCTSPTVVSGTMTLAPGKYCGLTFNNGSDLTMSPSGIYYITGPISVNTPGAAFVWRGSGVMTYLAPGASVDLNSNFVSLDLSAPTTGTYSGILFYQDRANTSDANLAKNGSGMTLSGALYFPSANLSVKNNNGMTTNDCTLIVAKTLSMNNNSQLSNTCSAYSGSPLMTVSLAE